MIARKDVLMLNSIVEEPITQPFKGCMTVHTLMRTPLRMRMPFCLSFFLGVSLDATTFCCFFWTLSCFLTTSSFSPTIQALSLTTLNKAQY